MAQSTWEQRDQSSPNLPLLLGVSTATLLSAPEPSELLSRLIRRYKYAVEPNLRIANVRWSVCGASTLASMWENFTQKWKTLLYAQVKAPNAREQADVGSHYFFPHETTEKHTFV